jgi:fructosamine-3-kinase
VTEKFVGGSNWSSAYVYTTQQGKEYFVKLAMGGRDDSMFQGEAQGLQAMYGKHQQRAPKERTSDVDRLTEYCAAVSSGISGNQQRSTAGRSLCQGLGAAEQSTTIISPLSACARAVNLLSLTVSP